MTYDPPPSGSTPLKDVKDWTRARARTGVKCPCCDQNVKIYRRTLPNATARVMIRLWRLDEGIDFLPAAYREPDLSDPDARKWTFLPKMLDRMTGTPHQGGYGTQGWFWGLLEQRPGVRPDGSNRVGWWRLTDLGVEYVMEKTTVPRYTDQYNQRRLGVPYGPDWSIRKALTTKFDYDELMGP